MKILIVDDDETFLDKMTKFLTLENHSVDSSTSVEGALIKINDNSYDLILTDLKMPGSSGIDLVKIVKERKINSIIMVITGYGTIDSAVNAMKLGAFDYILKPFDPDQLEKKLSQLELELQLRTDISYSPFFDEYKQNIILNKEVIKEFTTPILLISDDDPKHFIKKMDLKKVTSYMVSYDDDMNSIIPTKLISLKAVIDKFSKANTTGTIIIKAVEKLLESHEWPTIKKFFSYLQSEVISNEITLVLLFKDRENVVESTIQPLLNGTRSILINPIFYEILDVISHPIRKSIIALLEAEKAMNFNKIFKRLNIEKSSLLAFHMKKLVKDEVIKKNDNLYSLSSRGKFISKLIKLVEEMGFSDPHSNVKFMKISGEGIN